MDVWSDLVLQFLFFILWSMNSLFTSSGLHGSSIMSYWLLPLSFFIASLSWVSRQTWQHGLEAMAYVYSALGEDLAASHSSGVKKLSPNGLISDICYFSMQMIFYCLTSVLSVHTFQDFLYFREECEFIPLQVKCHYCHTVKSPLDLITPLYTLFKRPLNDEDNLQVNPEGAETLQGMGSALLCWSC